MAASALNEERQLAINPIVGTSVQHNTQVRTSRRQTRTKTHTYNTTPLVYPVTDSCSTPGHIQHPQSYRFAVRRRRRHTRPRVVRRLHILPIGVASSVCNDFCAQDGRKARRILLQAPGGFVVRGCVWWVERICADVDVVLRTGEGVRMEIGDKI